MSNFDLTLPAYSITLDGETREIPESPWVVPRERDTYFFYDWAEGGIAPIVRSNSSSMPTVEPTMIALRKVVTDSTNITSNDDLFFAPGGAGEEEEPDPEPEPEPDAPAAERIVTIVPNPDRVEGDVETWIGSAFLGVGETARLCGVLGALGEDDAAIVRLYGPGDELLAELTRTGAIGWSSDGETCEVETEGEHAIRGCSDSAVGTAVFRTITIDMREPE